MQTKQQQIEECSQAIAEEHAKHYPDYQRIESYKLRQAALLISEMFRETKWSN